MNFKEFPSNECFGGIQYTGKFENDYGFSCVRHSFSYGNTHGEGLWELAVLGKDGSLCYTTPITSDVIGHLTET